MKNDFKERIKSIYRKTIEYTKKRTGTVALFLCLLVAGIAVAAVFSGKPADDGRQVNDSQDERLEDVLNESSAPEETPEVSEVPETSAPETVETSAIPDFTKAPDSTAVPGTKDLLSPPVLGGVIWDYAMDELIYSETLDQWMTHSGVDIACSRGAEIRSVESGHAERVYDDDELGYTVIIEHENGDRSVYAGLAEDGLIAEGAKVEKNAVIGVCGNTAAAECALEVHIHFEYHKDGAPVNPADYILFTS